MPKGAKLTPETIEAKEEIIVVEVSDKAPQDRGLEVQTPVDVETGGGGGGVGDCSRGRTG